MDSYQAVYDAVRSRVNQVDLGAAVESVLTACGFDHYAMQIRVAHQEAASEHMRPCVMFRPSIQVDGNMWCALYGKDLQSGIAGFGKSVSDAMHDFDKNYHANLK